MSPPSISFCAGATCPRPTHYRFCNRCYYDRANRLFAIYKRRVAPIEAEIAEVKAIGKEVRGRCSVVLRELAQCEQIGDDEGVGTWRRRKDAEFIGYAVVMEEVDGYMRDLWGDREGLRVRLRGELGELSRRQVEG